MRSNRIARHIGSTPVGPSEAIAMPSSAAGSVASVLLAATVPTASLAVIDLIVIQSCGKNTSRVEEDGRRDREPDPNSPFAKLAVLKEQLEANKEPR